VPGNVPQELKNTDEIGFSRGIRSDNHIEAGQINIEFGKTLEIFHMDLLDWHENSGYVLVTLQQKEGIGYECGL
jgi:hypothetical protein